MGWLNNNSNVYTADDDNVKEIKAGSLEYVAQQGGNGAPLTYQEATGAPIETKSPLGLSVTWVSFIFLNINQMIGTGVFSTRELTSLVAATTNDGSASTILSGTGSVGLSLIYWFLGFVISACGLAIYMELASYFPSRSGSEAVYLEQAYPRPRYFFPVTFAIQSVLLSFSSSNSIGESNNCVTRA